MHQHRPPIPALIPNKPSLKKYLSSSCPRLSQICICLPCAQESRLNSVLVLNLYIRRVISKKMTSPLPLAEWLLPQNVERLVLPHLKQQYEMSMTFQMLKTYGMQQIGEVPQDFDASLSEPRWLSEIGICSALEYIELPSGFELEKNQELAFVYQEKRLRDYTHNTLQSHLYAKDTQSNVLCATFAQFYKNDIRNYAPGHRVNYFRKKLGDRVHVYPDMQIGILVGNIHEIGTLSGLWYGCHKPR